MAIFNVGIIDGKRVFEGEQVLIGGIDWYYRVCGNHFLPPP
ncbi:thymidine kinase, partial [Lactobacillus rhamnosus]|nr:thymidine kinase [Lacticaseibacillus rhamnosus]